MVREMKRMMPFIAHPAPVVMLTRLSMCAGSTQRLLRNRNSY
jgi:hypothetical protein